MEIVADRLTKLYGRKVAVDSVSFRIPEGRAFGLIGPNGAGKTTILKVLATLAKADSGAVTVGGEPVEKDPRGLRRRIGFMPDTFFGPEGLGVGDYLEFFGACYGLAGPARTRAVDDVLALTDLGGKREAGVGTLSKGMKQRLLLAKTLLHDPRLLLLDEPASGLDPRARIEIRELLKELVRMGKTILISSHILPDIEDLCSGLVVIEVGRIVAAGTFEDVRKQFLPKRRVTVRLKERGEAAFGRVREAFPGTEAVLAGDEIRLASASGDLDGDAVLRSLLDGGFKVAFYSEEEGRLEEVFLAITKGIVS